MTKPKKTKKRVRRAETCTSYVVREKGTRRYYGYGNGSPLSGAYLYRTRCEAKQGVIDSAHEVVPVRIRVLTSAKRNRKRNR